MFLDDPHADKMNVSVYIKKDLIKAIPDSGTMKKATFQ